MLYWIWRETWRSSSPRHPALQQGVDPFLQVVVLQEEPISPGGDDSARHRQVQVLDRHRQVGRFAPDEFGAVLGGFGQGDDQWHFFGEDQPAPEFGAQRNEDAVDGLIQVQIAVGGDEIQAFDHASSRFWIASVVLSGICGRRQIRRRIFLPGRQSIL